MMPRILDRGRQRLLLYNDSDSGRQLLGNLRIVAVAAGVPWPVDVRKRCYAMLKREPWGLPKRSSGTTCGPLADGIESTCWAREGVGDQRMMPGLATSLNPHEVDTSYGVVWRAYH